ncbi:response regulator, partial [Baaleninema sp.]|uniref:response regulator n=1 Tax=Baaleninema sp. TaxID=3101197 RepID=UPI003CFC5455
MAKQKTATRLIPQLALQSQKQLTGQLDIQAKTGQKWSLFFCVGRLIWATCHSHPVRALRRQIQLHSPKVDFDNLSIRDADKFFCWNYQVVWVLYKRKWISKEMAVAIIENSVTDILFDILQAERQGELAFEIIPHEALTMLRMQIVALNLKNTVKKAKLAFQKWNEAGLTRLSPNYLPVLKDAEQLKANTPAKVYQQLAKKINGERTLRELSDSTKIDCLRLTKSLLPYFQKGWIGLQKAPEIPRPRKKEKPPASGNRADRRQQPLVACVDDSPEICRQLEEILTEAGYRFLGITDSVQALPILLEQRPDMIFLDLVMPVANGYEVCTQLRRMSQFQNTPIAILTGNDGVVDRVRAKMVKASDFLSKPINAEKVIETVKRLLEV